jgi:hypothetical protein
MARRVISPSILIFHFTMTNAVKKYQDRVPSSQ